MDFKLELFEKIAEGVNHKVFTEGEQVAEK